MSSELPLCCPWAWRYSVFSPTFILGHFPLCEIFLSPFETVTLSWLRIPGRAWINCSVCVGTQALSLARSLPVWASSSPPSHSLLLSPRSSSKKWVRPSPLPRALSVPSPSHICSLALFLVCCMKREILPGPLSSKTCFPREQPPDTPTIACSLLRGAPAL